ncbi:MAG: ferredoxin reductase domain-containing protein [Deltaproteobacteria bacterium]
MEARREIRPLEVMVAEVVRETHDSVTLVFFTGNDALAYQAGHFLTIDPHQFPEIAGLVRYLEQVKGKREPARAYSMSSAPHERLLAVTVKEEPFVPEQTPYPPLLSPLLVHGVKPGRRMTVVGFTGPYVLTEGVLREADHLVHVCAGSGIVPNFSILKHALELGLPLRHTLVYANKSRRDIIFREQLEALERRHPGKLRVVHSLSREPEAERYGPGYRTGRVDRSVLAAAVGDGRRCVVYACGPGITPFERKAARQKGVEPTPRFLETVLGHLADLAIEKGRIHYESYG